MNKHSFAAIAALLATLPAAAADPPAKPNVLFIIFDDWGWQHAGANGCTFVKTPNFDRIAREGVLFKNCFTSNPKCSPCRATILTGRIEADQGNHIGYVRLVGRRQGQIELAEHVVSLPAQYTKKPLLRSAAG